MVWAQTLGGPHGGPSPTPQLVDLPIQQLYPGDLVVLTGIGFTPGSQVILEPGFKIVAISNPTITTTISFTLPFGLPNVKHKLYINNGNTSNSIDLFVIRDVLIETATSTVADVSLAEVN